MLALIYSVNAGTDHLVKAPVLIVYNMRVLIVVSVLNMNVDDAVQDSERVVSTFGIRCGVSTTEYIKT